LNKIRNYWKNKKGITLVWGAFFLVLCIMFLGLAVDIAYMYVVKNQLQVAADAAALAGTAKLDGTDSTIQTEARAEAVKFASANSAAGSMVVLASNGDNTLSNTNDITVGNWNPSLSPPYSESRIPINAVKVMTRRTSGSPGGPVSLFIGKVFGWSLMDARASAIASFPPLQRGPFPLCYRDCGMITPLTATLPNLTPGLRWKLKTHEGSPNIGWTTFMDNDTSKTNIEKYLQGIKTPPDICHQCIFTTQGIVGPTPCEVREEIRKHQHTYNVNGTMITGWRLLIPVLPEIPCPGGKGSGCFADPGYQPGDAYEVSYFAEVIITDAVPEGNCPHDPGPLADGPTGIVMVGTGPGVAGTSTVSCSSCEDPPFGLHEPPKLVK
jgi:hypothetical protein